MVSLKVLRASIKDASKAHLVCEKCGGPDPSFQPSLTAYSSTGLDIELDDLPNRAVFLCPSCYAEYVDYWTEMWREYRSSQGV